MTRDHSLNHLREFDAPYAPWKLLSPVNIRHIADVYTPEACALFLAHPDWDLAELERQCGQRGVDCFR